MGDIDYAHYRTDAFDLSLKGSNLYPLTASGISIFQINTGRLCNQACGHCHVEAGPDRGPLMPEEVSDLCLKTIEGIGRPQVYITGLLRLRRRQRLKLRRGNRLIF
ncbi:MAG: hypothetical protein HZB83_00865 [Deltaproteobacteria bacterium]|nr:hypothetical protein [Deltaproteobacteria bacterium]